VSCLGAEKNKDQGGEMDQEKLDVILKRIDKLPTLPQTSQRILVAIEQEASAQELEKIITEDQALAAKLLKLVNSPLYAPPQPVTNLRNAIVRLGFGEVRNVVLVSALNYMLKPKGTYKKFDLARLWVHALAVARGAFLLAQEEKFSDPETLYTGGLLHDLGRLALAVFFPEYFLQILALQEARDCSFWQAEQEVGLWHTEIGAIIAQHWRFSEELVSAIRYHHHPQQKDKLNPVAFLVFKGDIVARAAGMPPEEDYTRLPKWPRGLPLDKKLLSKIAVKLKKEKEALLKSWQEIFAT